MPLPEGWHYPEELVWDDDSYAVSRRRRRVLLPVLVARSRTHAEAWSRIVTVAIH